MGVMMMKVVKVMMMKVVKVMMMEVVKVMMMEMVKVMMMMEMMKVVGDDDDGEWQSDVDEYSRNDEGDDNEQKWRL